MIKRHELIITIADAACITTGEAMQALDAFEAAMEEVDKMNLHSEPDCCTEESYSNGNQHWRGGSRKKGGKIGYLRR